MPFDRTLGGCLFIELCTINIFLLNNYASKVCGNECTREIGQDKCLVITRSERLRYGKH